MAAITLAELPDAIKEVGRQFVFAGALALTWTAKDCQTAIRDELPNRFVIRNKWVQGGIRIIPADYKDQKPTSEIYSKDWFMRQQETGAKRKPPNSGQSVIPVAYAEVMGLNDKAIIKKPKDVDKFLNKKIGENKPFIGYSKKGAKGIFLRTTNERSPIRMLFKLQTEEVNIDKREWFQNVVDKTYSTKLSDNYDKALAYALKTAL